MTSVRGGSYWQNAPYVKQHIGIPEESTSLRRRDVERRCLWRDSGSDRRSIMAVQNGARSAGQVLKCRNMSVRVSLCAPLLKSPTMARSERLYGGMRLALGVVMP
jgi:hypothetical protein